MSIRRHMTFFLLLAALASGWARAEDLAEAVVGTWRLVSNKVERADGTIADLYGPAPLGFLIYDRSGFMSVHVGNPDLPKCGTQDRRKCPDAIARQAFDNYGSYWGRYEVNSTEKTVVHHIEGASAPDWMGTSQKRFIDVSGDRLTITTPPQPIGGVQSIVLLIWQRAK